MMYIALIYVLEIFIMMLSEKKHFRANFSKLC